MQIRSSADLAIVETHPVQYHAPVYRCLEQKFGIRTTAIYGSDFSVAGGVDREFGRKLAWDTDLLSGYTSVFLSRVRDGDCTRPERLSAAGVRGALDQASPKAVLLPGYALLFYIRTILSTARAGIPILFRGETTDHARSRGPTKAWLRDRLLGSFYRHCDALLYIGERSRLHFRRFERDGGDRIFYSPYCVDTSPFQTGESARGELRPAQREQLGINDKQLVLLFCGKLSRRKGPDLILSAIRQMPDEIRRRVVVVFLGTGEMKDSLRDLADKASVVSRFAGFQNQTQLSPFYHAADLLILPSRNSETWGLVVNEALHHGLPCVVSDAVGCAPDLIALGDTGEVAASGCAGSLAAAIRKAIALTGRVEIRENCRRHVMNYSVADAAEGIARAYRHVVKEGAR